MPTQGIFKDSKIPIFVLYKKQSSLLSKKMESIHVRVIQDS